MEDIFEKAELEIIELDVEEVIVASPESAPRNIEMMDEEDGAW